MKRQIIKTQKVDKAEYLDGQECDNVWMAQIEYEHPQYNGCVKLSAWGNGEQGALFKLQNKIIEEMIFFVNVVWDKIREGQ